MNGRYYKNRRYYKAIADNPLPELDEDERIYLKVPYQGRGFAKMCHCGFDSEKKLWFTGAYNSSLDALLSLYPLDEEHTSDRAKELLHLAMTADRETLRKAIDGKSKADE